MCRESDAVQYTGSLERVRAPFRQYGPGPSRGCRTRGIPILPRRPGELDAVVVLLPAGSAWTPSGVRCPGCAAPPLPAPPHTG